MFNKKIYKFKKDSGRSNFKLLIDDIEIGIKGKKLVNRLYKIIADDELNRYSVRDLQSKLDNIIFTSVSTSGDYVKYKFLIDASYEAFVKKSKEFLDKKVEEIDGEFVEYYDENRNKKLDGIKLTGMSGNSYIIAYDSKESFVFMNPSVKEDKTYESGNYICMVDQSNIKSNIGYDTVISKMLSLKHDSMIASQIYNLEDELNK